MGSSQIGANNTTEDFNQNNEEEEGKLDYFLMNSLENFGIIMILIIIIIVAAITLLIYFIKNWLNENKGNRKKDDDYNKYHKYNNEYNYKSMSNNRYNNYHDNNKFSDQYRKNINEFSFKQKQNYEMNEINRINNNNFDQRRKKNNINNNFMINKNNNFSNNINNINRFSNNKNKIYDDFSNNINNINNFGNDINNNNNFNNNNFNNINNNKNNNINIKDDLKPRSSISSTKMMIDEIDQIGFILSQIPEEPRIGLANIGATCYMNATLQCLSHTIRLSNFFLNDKNKLIINKKKFSREFLEVIKKLWIKSYNKNKTYYEPYSFKRLISEMNPLFEGVQANDAKDLINFILQELHEELNNAKINPIENQENMIFNVNQYDENQMFLNFIEEFKKNQKSIISDVFYFIIETKTECLNCRKLNRMRGINNPVYLYNFQIMNFLIFPLEEIRKYKIKLYQQNFQEVDLNDCFIYYQKIDYMQGENQMWCSNCNQNAPSQYMTSLYSSPVYLVLILNRGKGNIYNVKLNFSEILNIGNFVYMKKSNDLIYHLYAIVTHIGPSNMGGHFIAFCKSPIDNRWYKYNDAMVEFVGNFYSDIVNFGVPYILFYESQNL